MSTNVISPERQSGSSLNRLALIAALLTTAFALYFSFALNFSGRPLPHGLHRAILAMEVPVTADDIRLIVGCGVGETKAVPCRDPLDKQDRDTMRRAQFVDFVFIPCYVALFAFTGLLELATVRSGWGMLGLAATLLVVVAGVFDYLEDYAILQALDRLPLSQPDAAAIAYHGWWKWRFLFVVLLCLVPLMFASMEKSMTLKIISRLLLVFVVVSALAGLIACWLRHPARLEAASAGFAAIPLLILFRVFLRDGTLTGLNRLANIWGLRWLARWPEFLFGEDEEVDATAL